MSSSLSADAKDALARETVEAPHCRAALRDALLIYGVDPRRGVFRTQRAAVARLAWSLLEDRKSVALRQIAGTRLQRLPTYAFDVTPQPPPRKPTARCDRRMELRAAFLACGSLAAPARGYHLEFVPPGEKETARLEAALRSEGLEPKRATRKGRRVIYFKDVDAITRLLAAVGAAQAVFALEDVRALKETKNRIHRLVNTEAANVDRATTAAALQRESIVLVAQLYGLGNLRRALRETAELRLEHPTETLAELGRRCSPPAAKSTINGRLARLVRLAHSLVEKRGDAGATGNESGRRQFVKAVNHI